MHSSLAPHRSLLLLLILNAVVSQFPSTNSQCTKGCDLALASYYVWSSANLTFIADVMSSPVLSPTDFDTIINWNPDKIPNKDFLDSSIRILIPFPCDCVGGELVHVFNFSHVISGTTYDTVAKTYYSNLTTVDEMESANSYPANNIPDTGVTLNVGVRCGCGNSSVSKEYGLFATWPLRSGDTAESVASAMNTTREVVEMYNVGVNFTQGTGIVFVPARDLSGSYRPLTSSTGLASGAIAGIAVGAVVGVVLIAVCVYFGFYRKKKVKQSLLLPTASQELSAQASDKPIESIPVPQSPAGITVDKSTVFSYEELAGATDDFSMAHKIGQGGFGSVYYAELRGEKAAIKKMDMQASKEFLAELKVLTHVHHVNLVRLIGYCVEGSLCLVYEYIENGNLSQHLRGSGKDPLSWSARVQIALDSARGLEYIHEHTVPVYIHRDIKSANILIDKNFRGKVADFGLTKLTEVGSASLPTRLVGTFGYMPPEYAQYGDVSPKVDVYAFGVVLYELISAKDAIIKGNSSAADSVGLVALFEEVLNHPDAKEELRKLIDPQLGDNYPHDSVRKMAQLAKACTHENPQLRPTMRSIVVALMTLSSSTEDWDVGSFYENQALVNLMSGR